MTTYLTPYDPPTRYPTGPSQPLPADTLDAAAQLMGEPDRRYPAMLLYYGPPAFCVSRCVISIDAPSNSGQNEPDYNEPGSNQP